MAYESNFVCTRALRRATLRGCRQFFRTRTVKNYTTIRLEYLRAHTQSHANKKNTPTANRKTNFFSVFLCECCFVRCHATQVYWASLPHSSMTCVQFAVCSMCVCFYSLFYITGDRNICGTNKQTNKY